MAHILVNDPQAIVVMFPSDHFVFPEHEFVNAAERIALAASYVPEKLVLLGACPDGPETEYGWISPGSIAEWVNGEAVRHVLSFREKPSGEEARRLRAEGSLWNTMVMAAQVRTVWEFGRRRLPTVIDRFEELLRYLGTKQEQEVLDWTYQRLPSVNFSSELLEEEPTAAVVLELHNVVWSDWGREERIVGTLRRIGKKPWFDADQ